ncbi:MAG TPA: autotransporter-associated beta strand repeat-containing protein, partial [Lacunisphaera sp.]
SGAINDGGIGGGTGGSLTVDGQQTLTLSGSSSFTGITTVTSNSTIAYASSAAFAQTSNIAVTGGSSIQLLGGIAGGSKTVTIAGSGTNGALENVSGSNSLAGQVILSNSATVMTDSASALALTGGVNVGTRALTVKGSGTTTIGAITGTTGSLNVNAAGGGLVDLTGANTYTGATSVTAGSLELGNGGTSGSLSTSSAITDNGSLIVNRSNSVAQGTDFSGSAISGSGSFQQIGTGTTTLNAANTYHGGTTVSSGGLLVSNGLSGSATGTGSLTVNAGAFLGGAGQVNASGFAIGGAGPQAQVQVGNGADTTSVLALNGTNANTITNTQLTFNISATTLGQGNELSVGTSAITFSSSTLALNVVGAAIIPAYTPYVLIAGTGSNQYSGLTISNETINGTTFAVITGGLNLAFSPSLANTWYASHSFLFLNTAGGVDDIEVSVVPEPSTWALIVGGFALLIFWQRRRNMRKN